MSYYPPIVSALVTLILILFLTLNKDGAIKDIPSEPSLHSEPVPRVGGLGIMAGMSALWDVSRKVITQGHLLALWGHSISDCRCGFSGAESSTK